MVLLKYKRFLSISCVKVKWVGHIALCSCFVNNFVLVKHVTRFAALFLKCKYSVFFEHAVSFLPSEYVKNCTKITLSCRRICCFL